MMRHTLPSLSETDRKPVKTVLQHAELCHIINLNVLCVLIDSKCTMLRAIKSHKNKIFKKMPKQEEEKMSS